MELRRILGMVEQLSVATDGMLAAAAAMPQQLPLPSSGPHSRLPYAQRLLTTTNPQQQQQNRQQLHQEQRSAQQHPAAAMQVEAALIERLSQVWDELLPTDAARVEEMFALHWSTFEDAAAQRGNDGAHLWGRGPGEVV